MPVVSLLTFLTMNRAEQRKLELEVRASIEIERVSNLCFQQLSDIRTGIDGPPKVCSAVRPQLLRN